MSPRKRSLNCLREQFKLFFPWGTIMFPREKNLNYPKEQPCALGSKALSCLGEQPFPKKQMCLKLCLIVIFAYEFWLKCLQLQSCNPFQNNSNDKMQACVMSMKTTKTIGFFTQNKNKNKPISKFKSWNKTNKQKNMTHVKQKSNKILLQRINRTRLWQEKVYETSVE